MGNIARRFGKKNILTMSSYSSSSLVGCLGAKDDKFAVALAMDRSVTAFGGAFFKHISLLIHMTISRINLLQVVAEKNSFRKPKPFCAIVQLCFDLFLFLYVCVGNLHFTTLKILFGTEYNGLAQWYCESNAWITIRFHDHDDDDVLMK